MMKRLQEMGETMHRAVRPDRVAEQRRQEWAENEASIARQKAERLQMVSNLSLDQVVARMTYQQLYMHAFGQLHYSQEYAAALVERYEHDTGKIVEPGKDTSITGRKWGMQHKGFTTAHLRMSPEQSVRLLSDEEVVSVKRNLAVLLDAGVVPLPVEVLDELDKRYRGLLRR